MKKQYVFSGKQMKELDRYTIQELCIPSMVLMERAAYSALEEIECLIDPDSNTVVICGSGNNGADGVALARMLYLKGYAVTCFCKYLPESEQHCSDEFQLQVNIARNIGMELISACCADSYSKGGMADIEVFIEEIVKKADVVIDAIFGIGLTRNVEGIDKQIIDIVNMHGKKVYSIDMPSGICSDTGKIMGSAVKAHMTITFSATKKGLLLYPGAAYAGSIKVKDIGIPGTAYKHIEPSMFTYDPYDRVNMPDRMPYSNKGTFGTLLVIGGSEHMTGAAYLAAKAAYRTGTGIVMILACEESREVLQGLIPEAIVKTYKEDLFDRDAIEPLMEKAQAIVIGPGLSVSNTSVELVRIALKQRKPTVIDADALNAIAANDTLIDFYHEQCVITPHPGEMSRLMHCEIKDVTGSLIESALEYAKRHRLTVAMKDARTIVTNGKDVYINQSGNSGMATGGSGDVLSGMIGSLLMTGIGTFHATHLGVYMHGKAGDLAAFHKSEYSMMASDIADAIGDLTNESGQVL